jgi:hypothetical protein
MKKKDDAYCDFEGRMYPFSSCSSMKTSRASSSVCVIGYTLQSMVSGTPGLKSMAWLHDRLGGNRCDSSSLNTFANFWYSFGISAFFVYCWAATANSTEVFRMVGGSPPTSCSNSCYNYPLVRLWKGIVIQLLSSVWVDGAEYNWEVGLIYSAMSPAEVWFVC